MSAELQPDRDGAQKAIRASDAERRQVVAALQAACVDGRLTLDEYGQRVGRAFAALSRDEIQVLLSDLPPESLGAATPTRRVSTTLAVLASAERSGFWRLAEDCRVLAVLGSCKLDLRAARVSGPVTTIDVRAILGSVTIIVPPGVEVDIEVHALLGSRDTRLAGRPPAHGAPGIRITGHVILGSLTVLDAATSATEHQWWA